MKKIKFAVAGLSVLFFAVAVSGAFSLFLDGKTQIRVWADYLSLTAAVQILLCAALAGVAVTGAGMLVLFNKNHDVLVAKIGINLSAVSLSVFLILLIGVFCMQVITRLASRFTTPMSVALGKGLLALLSLAALIFTLVLRDRLVQFAKASATYLKNGMQTKTSSVFTAVCCFILTAVAAFDIEKTSAVTLVFGIMGTAALMLFGVFVLIAGKKLRPIDEEKRELYLMNYKNKP